MKLSPKWSGRLHDIFGAIKPSAIEFGLGRHVAGAGFHLRVPIRHDASLTPFCIRLEKDEQGRLSLSMDRTALGNDAHLFSTLWRRGGVFINIFSDPSVRIRSALCDLTDAAQIDGPILSFCSNREETILVPDRGFYVKGGYQKYRGSEADLTPWHKRDGTVLWRGRPTDHGLAEHENMTPDNPELMFRVRMCLALRDVNGVDAKLVVRTGEKTPQAELYRRCNIAGDFVPEEKWALYKFAIDIDGQANAFTNLYVRLLLGCCVIKITSQLNFRQWYYADLEPWQHFVPVKADLSNLVEIIRWCRANDDACRQIAQNGHRFAMARTVETERRRTIERINAVLGRPARASPAKSSLS